MVMQRPQTFAEFLAALAEEHRRRLLAQSLLATPQPTTEPLPEPVPWSQREPILPRLSGPPKYQRREAPKPTLLERVGPFVSPLADVPLPGMGISPRRLGEGAGRILAPVEAAIIAYDELAAKYDLPPSEAFFLAAPPAGMAVGGIGRGIQEVKAGLRGAKAMPGAVERAVGRVIETGGVSAGIPAPARVTAARAAKEPEFLTLKGVDAELRRMSTAIKSGERIKADTSAIKEGRDELAVYRRNLLQSELTESQWDDLLRAEERLDELTAELDVFGAGAETGLLRPPAHAKGGIGLWPAARLRMLAKHEGLNPAQPDWWDSIDSVVVKELRGAHVPKAQTRVGLQREITSVKAEIRNLERGAPTEARPMPAVPGRPIVTGPGMQASMGIGERAPQGQLLPEYIGAGERVPLASPEQLAARQARAAEVARGQAEMPLARGVAPAVKEPWQMTQDAFAKQRIAGIGNTFYRQAQTKQALTAHRLAIEQALREGKPVPPEVLADYPDLAAAAKPVAGPAPGLPIPGVRGATELVTPAEVPIIREGPVAPAAAVPPTVSPRPGITITGIPPRRPIPPVAEAAGAAVPPQPKGIQEALAQAKAIVARDKPGIIARVAARLPGVKQPYQRLVPASHLPDNILEGWVGQGLAEGTGETQGQLVRSKSLQTLDELFGKDATRTRDFKPEGIQFIGTKAERAVNATGDYTGTLRDIAERPTLYDGLTPVQRDAVAQAQIAKDTHLNAMKSAYNLDIGQFPTQPGGMHLANVDVSESGLEMSGSVEAALTRGRAKERFYPTMADRLHADPTFRPETTVASLLAADDTTLARMAGRKMFLESAGGKTRLAVMQETHPELAARMEGLNKKLTSVKSAAERLGGKQGEVIDDFLASPMEETDLVTLLADLNPTIGANAVGRQGVNFGKDLKALRAEVASVRSDIIGLRPSWRVANLKPYVRVQEAGNLLYPAKEAAQIKQLLETSNNPWLRLLDNIRATAFGGDFSPFTIQMATEWLSDPIGASKFIVQGKAAVTQEGMMSRMAQDVVGFERFTKGTGLNPLGGVSRDFASREFSVGYLAGIPKVGEYWTRFNDAVYRPVMLRTKAVFDSSYKGAIELGLTEEQAIAVAADDATKILPRYSFRRLGQSQKVAAQSRAVLTSVSFLTQPASLMSDAVKGMLKLGTKQAITPTERFAVKRVLTLVATTESIAVLSGVAYAETHNQDRVQAVKDALNPSSGKFASLILPNGARFGLGGPFRSIIRAVAPKQIPGVPVPMPFAGLYNFALGKLAPVPRVIEASIKNLNYYRKRIRTGDFPVNILQNLIYAGENVIPLTLGSVAQQAQLHTLSPKKIGGTDIAVLGQEAVSQFMGTNYIPLDPIWDAKIRWNKDLKTYSDIPGDDRERKAKLAEARAKGDTEAIARYGVSRDAYLRANPEVDAKVFITGVRESLQKSRLGTHPARPIVVRLMRENNLTVSDLKSMEEREYEKSTDDRVLLRQWLQGQLGETQTQKGRKEQEQKAGSAPAARATPTPWPLPAGQRYMTDAEFQAWAKSQGIKLVPTPVGVR